MKKLCLFLRFSITFQRPRGNNKKVAGIKTPIPTSIGSPEQFELTFKVSKLFKY